MQRGCKPQCALSAHGFQKTDRQEMRIDRAAMRRGATAAGAWLIAIAAALQPRQEASRREGPPRDDVIAGGWSASTWPAKSWAILQAIYEQVQRDRVLLVAAGITYYALLALFPALTALVSVYGLFADPTAVTSGLNNFSGLLPGGAIAFITDQTQRITSQSTGSLSTGLVVGLAVALWSASSGVKAVFQGLNVAYDQHDTRSFLHLSWLSLLFTVGAIVVVVVALVVIVAAPAVLHFAGLGSVLVPLVQWGRWPLFLFAIVVGISLLYRFGPDREVAARWRWISPGGVAASLVWLAASALFSVYVANFASYNATYGSLGAVIGFMIWLWLSACILLLGAELDAVLAHDGARRERGRERGRLRA